MGSIPFGLPEDGRAASYAAGEEFVGLDLTLHGMLDRSALAGPTSDALIFLDRRLSYGEVQQGSFAVAAALANYGVEKGDRVAIMLPNCPQYVMAFYGVMRLGAIVVQVSPMYTEREILEIVEDSGARAIVAYAPLLPRVLAADRRRQLRPVVSVGFDRKTEQESVLGHDPRAITWERWLTEGLARVAILAAADPVYPADPAVLQYTGGTTGRSKGVVLTHGNLVANTLQSRLLFPEGMAVPGVRVLCAIPLFHVYGMTVGMNFSVSMGAVCLLVPRFEVEEILSVIKRYQPKFFPGVPTMYLAIANHPRAREYGVNAIEICNSGSAPLPLEVQQRFEEVTGAAVLEGYGLSEASPVTHSNRYGQVRKVGSVGPAIPGTEAAIVDAETGTRVLPVNEPGELAVRGPQVMQQYWNRPEETADVLRDGWLLTGDIARMDEDGYVYIVDRKKDIVIASGFNVYPREVEEVLYTHPAVLEAVAVGVPDEYRGETVAAFIVLKPGMAASAQELDGFCRERLAAYKAPRMFFYRESLPKSAVGKALRRVLREEARSLAAAAGESREAAAAAGPPHTDGQGQVSGADPSKAGS